MKFGLKTETLLSKMLPANPWKTWWLNCISYHQNLDPHNCLNLCQSGCNCTPSLAIFTKTTKNLLIIRVKIISLLEAKKKLQKLTRKTRSILGK